MGEDDYCLGIAGNIEIPREAVAPDVDLDRQGRWGATTVGAKWVSVRWPHLPSMIAPCDASSRRVVPEVGTIDPRCLAKAAARR
jgi:hypothetical protein